MSEKSRLPKRALTRACRAITREHPTFRDVEPSVKPKVGGEYILTFRQSTSLPQGGTLRQVLRATVNGAGDVLRVVLSK